MTSVGRAEGANGGKWCYPGPRSPGPGTLLPGESHICLLPPSDLSQVPFTCQNDLEPAAKDLGQQPSGVAVRAEHQQTAPGHRGGHQEAVMAPKGPGVLVCSVGTAVLQRAAVRMK